MEYRLVVELDGSGHARRAQVQHDYIRDQYLTKRGLHVLRFTNEQVLNDLEPILRIIKKAFPLSLQGEGQG